MLVSLIASSQVGTKNITTDSLIVLPKIVAKQVVKDIIRLDSCQDEMIILKNSYNLLEKNNIYKDSIISNKGLIIEILNDKLANYESMLSLKDIQKSNLESSLKKMDKELKKTKRKLKITQISSLAVVVFITYLAVK